MSDVFYRPIPLGGEPWPREALLLAGGWARFAFVAEHRRGRAPRLIPAGEVPAEVLARLTGARAPVRGVSLNVPRIMGILNVTPDSFSDGGRFDGPAQAVAAARDLVAAGADILDIGGESTRPGAEPVGVAEEIDRVVPVIAALRAAGVITPISIDTRKAAVARAAFAAGAELFNDVSALSHDPDSLATAAELGGPVCLMHARGDPRTMQLAPRYDDVLVDVAEYLEARLAVAEAAGIPRQRILVDPGIGFGKTVAQNLALLRGLSVLHATGCAILLGASRKRFIGEIAGVPEARARAPGSIAVALEGLRMGAQVIRVHDVAETRQAIALWRALDQGAREAEVAGEA